MSNYGKSQRACGSCEHWSGSRTTDDNRNNAITSSTSAKCYKKSSGSTPMNSSSHCSNDWEKWSALG